MGESKTLGPFVKACDQFKYLDLILNNAELELSRPLPAADSAEPAASDDTAINRILSSAWSAA